MAVMWSGKNFTPTSQRRDAVGIWTSFSAGTIFLIELGSRFDHGM